MITRSSRKCDKTTNIRLAAKLMPNEVTIWNSKIACVLILLISTIMFGILLSWNAWEVPTMPKRDQQRKMYYKKYVTEWISIWIPAMHLWKPVREMQVTSSNYRGICWWQLFFSTSICCILYEVWVIVT